MILFWLGLVVALTTQALAADGSLAAIVVADDVYRTPLAAADVTISSATDSEFRRSAVTGDDGACLFDRLPPGIYVVRAGKSEFVTAAFGATADDDDPTPIVVTANHRTTGIEMRLSAGGTVTGVVRDARGVPAPHVTVALMTGVGDLHRLARLSDAASVGAVVRTDTDNDGVYRLHGLPRGRYLVQATVVDAGPTLTMSRGYYPAAVDPIGGSTVDVSAGQDVTGIDLQMQPLPLANVSGSIAWPASQPRPNVRLLLFPEGLFAHPDAEDDGHLVVESPDGMFSNPISAAADNTFTIRGVPPGRYDLWLRSVPANALAPDDVGPAIWGRTTIAVDGKDLNGVAIEPHPSTTVSGHVDVGGRTLKGMSVALTPTETPGLRSRALRVLAPVAADGTFEVVGVTPGRYRIDVKLPSAWSMTSARAGTRDVFEVPCDLAPGEFLNDVKVTVAAVRQTVHGTLIGRDDRPAGGMRVVIFPVDRALWTNDARRIRTLKTTTDGAFEISGLPAGTYLLGAMTTKLDAARPDIGALDALVPASVPFTLTAGDDRVINLRVTR